MTHATRFGSLSLSASLVLTLLLLPSLVSAATHTVRFGGSLGDRYEPASLNVQVGDVIVFEGDFAFHPLQFQSVPSGANQPATVSSGTSFSYPIAVAGSYSYVCLNHQSLGMTGSFTAQGQAGVLDQASSEVLLSLMPNPAVGQVQLRTDEGAEMSTVELIDAAGRAVRSGGLHLASQVDLDLSGLPAGVYLVRVQLSDRVVVRKLIIAER